MGPPTGYGNEPFSAQTSATTVSFGNSTARKACFGGAFPYSPIFEYFGLPTLILRSAYGYERTSSAGLLNIRF